MKIRLLFIAPLLLAAVACTPERDLQKADAARGPGYPVDSRDRLTSDYQPLNKLKLGGPENPEAPVNKTIGSYSGK